MLQFSVEFFFKYVCFPYFQYPLLFLKNSKIPSFIFELHFNVSEPVFDVSDLSDLCYDVFEILFNVSELHTIVSGLCYFLKNYKLKKDRF